MADETFGFSGSMERKIIEMILNFTFFIYIHDFYNDVHVTCIP